MSISCTPSDLALAAKSFQGMAPEQRRWVDTYLLALIAGGSTDPEVLAVQSKAFKGVQDGMLPRIMAYLLCQISSGGSGSTQDMQIAWTPTNLELGSSGFINNISASASTVETLIYKGTNYTGQLDVTAAPVLTSVSFPNAISLGSVAFQNCISLNTFLIPLVVSANQITVTAASNSLVSFSAPSLTTGNITLYGNPSLASLILPLWSNGSIDLENSIVTTLNLASLVTSSGTFVDSNSALTTVIFTNAIPTNGLDQTWTNNALNQASVDLILHRCVLNAAYVSGTVDLTGGTNASPSVTGLADKATLVGRGVTVNTN